MPQIDCYPVNFVENDALLYAVVGAKKDGRWIFCRHHLRSTWEIPGGHCEKGEFIADCARRELREETGALEYELFPVCAYSVTEQGEKNYGMLFYAEVTKTGPLQFEIDRTELFDGLPENLTYPEIQPVLFEKLRGGGRRPAGVIFDMDGLMLDTEQLYQDGWITVGRQLGYEIPRSLFAESTGLGYQVEKELFRRRLGDGFDFDDAWARRDLLVQESIRKNGVPVKPGLFELLDALDQKGIKKAVATSTPRKTCESWLRGAGLFERFDTLVFGDMVRRGKPDPDIFLLAASRLGLEPGRCMVLEDSINGIRAAHRAGMLPAMVPDTVQPGEDTVSLLYAKLSTLSDVVRFGIV